MPINTGVITQQLKTCLYEVGIYRVKETALRHITQTRRKGRRRQRSKRNWQRNAHMMTLFMEIKIPSYMCVCVCIENHLSLAISMHLFTQQMCTECLSMEA